MDNSTLFLDLPDGRLAYDDAGDWPDPTAEAHWIQERLGSELLMLDRAGHHPHVEYPREIADAVAAFSARLWES